MKTETLSRAIELAPPPGTFNERCADWQIRIAGFERRRTYDGGPMLTLAVVEYRAPSWRLKWHRLGDVCARMKCADWALANGITSAFPVNQTKHYGPRGRGFTLQSGPDA